MNYELRTMNYELRVTSYELHSDSYNHQDIGSYRKNAVNIRNS